MKEYIGKGTKIIVYYVIADDVNEVQKESSCIEFYYSGKLPKTFNLRGDKLFYRHIPLADGMIIQRIECYGKVRFCDLKNCVPTIFDRSFIRKIEETIFLNKNKSIIVQLASKILSSDEITRLLE